jgi:hypothetical protein
MARIDQPAMGARGIVAKETPSARMTDASSVAPNAHSPNVTPLPCKASLPGIDNGTRENHNNIH